MKRVLLLFMCVLMAGSADSQTLPGLDATFGTHGIVLDSNIDGSGAYPNNLALQSDGKIVAVGSVIARYLSNGNRDNSFGGTGIQNVSAFGVPSGSIAANVLIQSDGKIFVIGGGDNYTPFVLKLKTNGTADSTFGTYGVATSCCMSTTAGALQPDGKIVVAGQGSFILILWRFKANGTIDSTFGVNGRVTTTNGNYDGNIGGVHVMPDGRIVIGGIGYNAQGFRSVMAMRFMPDGSFDTSLGHVGKVYPVVEDYCRDMQVASDGKIVLPIGGLGSDAAVMRLKIDGSIDSTFGQQGFVDVPNMRIWSLQILANGKMVCGGDNENDFVLARVKANGVSVDSTFGQNGTIATDVSGFTYDRIVRIAVQSDDKIIAGGRSQIDNTFSAVRLTLVRYALDARVSVATGPAQPGNKIYPNPISTTLNIDVDDAALSNGSYRIINLQGQTLATGAITSTHTTIDLAQLPASSYLAAITINGHIHTHIFTKT